ncbi:MAG: FAD-dependent oxidoreductase [Spirochaetaceae bacterium]|nr:FAD-dependent oxidoreductase [Spirochaetaceae bacterium]
MLKQSQWLKAAAFIGLCFLGASLLTVCASSAGRNSTSQVRDGVYEATARGRNGDVPVTTTLSGGKITRVEVGENIETSVFTSRAIPVLIESIVQNNSYGVDAVAGATITSFAIKTAVADAVRQAGGDAGLYGKPPAVARGKDETIIVDVAVVGAGISGIMAASNAADRGARVALLEKTTVIGGCSLQSFGTMAYGIKSEVERGEKTAELIRGKFNAWIEKEMFRVDASLLDAYLKNAGSAMDYLINYGFLGQPMDFFGSRGILLIPYDERQAVLEKMLDATVVRSGGAVYRETTARSLLYEDGVVTGVLAGRADGSTLTVRAKAVVIATGGYGGNTRMVYETSGVRAEMGCLGSTVGEGIQMGWAVGAKVPSNLGGLQLHQTLAPAYLQGYDYFHMRMPLILGYLPSLLNVSSKGIRFRNEAWNNNAVAASNSAAFTGANTFVLVSQSTLDKLERGGIGAVGTDISPSIPPELKPDFGIDTPWPNIKKVMEDTVKGGWAFKGNTIEEAAAAARIDPVVLKETVDTYERYCRNGNDEYFDKPAKYLVSYEYGPYYLVESSYNQLGTTTGLVVNAKMQVLDTGDNPIGGLYSCGSDAASTLYNNMYTGQGDCIGFAITSGKIAGESSADFANGG